MHPMARISLDVNGKVQTIDADPDMPLLYALRNDLGLNNPHFGCGLAQCGYCINVMIMESAAALATNQKQSEAEIKQALAKNLCRCGTNARIVRAVKRASNYA